MEMFSPVVVPVVAVVTPFTSIGAVVTPIRGVCVSISVAVLIGSVNVFLAVTTKVIKYFCQIVSNCFHSGKV